ADAIEAGKVRCAVRGHQTVGALAAGLALQAWAARPGKTVGVGGAAPVRADHLAATSARSIALASPIGTVRARDARTAGPTPLAGSVLAIPGQAVARDTAALAGSMRRRRGWRRLLARASSRPRVGAADLLSGPTIVVTRSLSRSFAGSRIGIASAGQP